MLSLKISENAFHSIPIHLTRTGLKSTDQIDSKTISGRIVTTRNIRDPMASL